MSQGVDERTERERSIFGAGFAFGVMFTLLILAVVLSTVVPGPVTIGTLLSSAVLLPVVAAIAFAAVVGSALYVLALPERGIGLPRRTVFERDADRESDAE